MIGFIRASSRFLRDRRILLGSFIAVCLSHISLLWVFSAISPDSFLVSLKGIYLVFAGMFWPLLWGIILSSILPREEYRQGTLELLLLTPVSPYRMVGALWIISLVITNILIVAVFPALFLCFSLMNAPEARMEWAWDVITFLPVVWFALLLVLLSGSSSKNGQENGAVSLCILFLLLAFAVVWHSYHTHLFTGGREFLIIFPMSIPAISQIASVVLKKPFPIEEWNHAWRSRSQNRSMSRNLFSDLYRALAEKNETIPIYDTLERIRNRRPDGAIEENKTFSTILYIELILITAIVLLNRTVWNTVLTVERVGILIAWLLPIALFFIASTAMREILIERRSRRLESLCLTLLSLREILRFKEFAASIRSWTVMKWVFIGGSMLATIGEDSLNFRLALFILLCGLQLWLAFRIAARVGFWLGANVKDELEGILWILLGLIFWGFIPWVGLKAIPADWIHHSFFFSIQSILSLSPFYIIVTLSSVSSWFSFLPALFGLLVQWLGYVWIGWASEKRIILAEN